jgi:hypothetical protein
MKGCGEGGPRRPRCNTASRRSMDVFKCVECGSFSNRRSIDNKLSEYGVCNCHRQTTILNIDQRK